MKDKLGLWHADGTNAYFLYAIGPDNGVKVRFRANSPLYTEQDANHPQYIMSNNKVSAILKFHECRQECH